MLLKQRLERLTEGIEKKEPPYLVKGFFTEYVSSFKRLKNPTKEQDKTFADIYTSYVNYLEFIKEKQK